MSTTPHTVQGRAGSLAVREWAAPSPRLVAVLVHGYGEHGGRYAHVAAALNAIGATAVAADHAGHGESDGERARVDDVEDLVADLHAVIEDVRGRHPGLPVVLVGHSLGGLVAARYAQVHEGLAALVLSAPVVGGNPDIEALLELDPLPEVPLDPAILSRDPAVGAAYEADPLVYHGPFLRVTLEAIFAGARAVQAGPGYGELPTLWVHGTDDGLAPLAATQPVMDRLLGPAAERTIYEGARHEVFNELNGDEVIARVTSFVDGAVPA